MPKKATKVLKSTLDHLHNQLNNQNNAVHSEVDVDDLELEFQKRKKDVRMLIIDILAK